MPPPLLPRGGLGHDDALAHPHTWRTPTAYIYNSTSHQCARSGVKSLAPGKGVLYATGGSCQIVTVDVREGEVQQRFEASKYPISCMVLTPGGRPGFGLAQQHAASSLD